MNTYRKIMLPSSGLFETCARHTSRSTARTLQSIYVCDPCAERLTRKAFNDRHPVFHGRAMSGYCGLCNHWRVVTQRQWFVCGPCWNIVLSYQKSIASSRAVRAWWKKDIANQFPHLELVETEAVYLSPYKRAAQTKLQGAATIRILDFQVIDTSKKPMKLLFHIEQKAGPASISEMKEFQLDVNDYNDIAGAMNVTLTPAYVVHVQAGRQYALPTNRTVAQGLWWTDMYTLKRNQKRVATRRGSDKKAIYFKPSAFRSIGTFSNELAKKSYLAMARRIKSKKLRLVS